MRCAPYVSNYHKPLQARPSLIYRSCLCPLCSKTKRDTEKGGAASAPIHGDSGNADKLPQVCAPPVPSSGVCWCKAFSFL